MAVIKQSKMAVIRSTLIPERDKTAGQTSAICLLPDGGGEIYFCGEALDKDSLYPIEAKIPSVLSALATPSNGNTVTMTRFLENGAFISGRSYAYAPRHTSNDSSAGIFPFKIRPQYRNNLDLNSRVNNTGKLFKFTDRTGVVHTLYNSVEYYTSGSFTNNYFRWGFSYLTLFEGTDPNTNFVSRVRHPRSSSLVFLGNVSTSRTAMGSQEFYPVYVDTANNRIWGLSPFSITTVNSGNEQSEEYILRPAYISYTTRGESGTLSLVPETLFAPSLFPAAEAAAGGVYGAETGVYYFIGGSGSSTYWLLASEQDYNQGGTWATLTGNWAVPTYWNKNTNGTRISIVKVDGDVTCTILLGPLGKSTGWSANTGSTTISDNYGHHMMPSPFVESPKAGEANVFYSYMPVVSTTDQVSYLVIRWNKTTDTFDVRAATTTGFDPNSFYRHPSARNTQLLMAFPSLEVITAASGAKYLVQFTRHYHVSNFIATGTAGEDLYNAVLVMAIDSNDPRNLTFAQTLPQTRLLDMIPLETHGRRMAAISELALTIYNFDEVNFLTAGSVSNGKYIAAGKDQDSNIFAVSVGSDNLISPNTGASPFNLGGTENFVTANLEYITNSLTSRASVVFQDPTIQYAGVNLNKNLIVNAYDEAGGRISTNLVLKLSTDVATFASNGLKTITISTSAVSDTLVGITITGAGSINASASFTI